MSETTSPRPLGARERARRAMVAEISSEAMALFLANGFDATTLEQIAEAVQLSTRSVSRYFASKEEIVVSSLTEVGADVAQRLAARPEAEPAWEAMRRALDGEVAAFDHDTGRLLATATMLSQTPALRGAIDRKHEEWEKQLVPLLVTHMDGSGEMRELGARAIVNAILACLTIAVDAWRIDGGQGEVGPRLDAAIAAIRR